MGTYAKLGTLASEKSYLIPDSLKAAKRNSISNQNVVIYEIIVVEGFFKHQRNFSTKCLFNAFVIP